MELLLEVLVHSAAFLGLCVLVFAPLESLMPARAMRERPPLSDWLMFVSNPALGAWAVLAVVATIGAAIRANLPAEVRAFTSEAPIAVQFVVVVFLANLWTYWIHRWSHQILFLWRFHRVHHSITEMNWVAAHRQHPVDVLLMQCGANLPAFVLGVNLAPLAAFVLIERCWTVLLHTNIDFRFGGIGDRILASPRFHHWHHDAAGAGRTHNFGGMFAFFDWVFGSWHPVDDPVEEIGPRPRGPDVNDATSAEPGDVAGTAG